MEFVEQDLPFAEETLASSLEEHHASLSVSQDAAKDSREQAALPSTLSGFCERYSLGGSSGKMSRAHFRAGRTDSSTSTFLSEHLQNAGMVSHGGFLTLNLSEASHSASQSRNGGVVCSLSDVLETGRVPERYYLTAKACQGILRRAESRHKELPGVLKEALEYQSERLTQRRMDAE